MKLERYDPPRSFPTKPLPWVQCDDGDWCKSEDVAELEAKYAELEAKCAELGVKYAELEALNAEMLNIIGLVHHCSYYYDVPIGIVQRMEKVIAKAGGGANE